MTLLALVVAVTAGAQSSSWDPDYNADNIIGTDDLLGLLSVFGMDWLEQAEILVIDSIPESEIVLELDTGGVCCGSVTSDLRVRPFMDTLSVGDFDALIFFDHEFSFDQAIANSSAEIQQAIADAEAASNWSVSYHGLQYYLLFPHGEETRAFLTAFYDESFHNGYSPNHESVIMNFYSDVQDVFHQESIHYSVGAPEKKGFLQFIRLANKWMTNANF